MSDNHTWWAPIPRTLRDDPEITPIDLAVYCALSWRMDWNTRDCFPSLATIAEDAKAGLTAVKASLNRLEERGYIIRKKRRSDDGNFYTSTRYTILLDVGGLVATRPTVGRQATSN